MSPTARPLVAAVAAVTLGLACACQGKRPPCGGATAARIDGEEVACDDFLRALYQDQGDAFFQRFLDAQLVEREARRLGVDVPADRIAAAVDRDIDDTIATRFSGARQGLVDQMARYGMTFEAWREGQIRAKRVDLLVEEILHRAPGAAAVREAFEQRFGKDGRRPQIRQILIGTSVPRSRLYPRERYEAEKGAVVAEARERATRARERLAAGEAAEAVAAELSDLPGRVEATAGEPQPVQAFVERGAALALSPVLETPRGFEVVRIGPSVPGAHYQGAHMFFSAKAAGAQDARTAEERFAEAKKRADAARARVLAGEGFGDVAGEVTEDGVTRPRNGDLGAFETGRLGPEVDAALSELPLQTCSAPIRTEAGYELVYLLGRERDPGLDRRNIERIVASTDYLAVKARRLGRSIEAEAAQAAEGIRAELASGGDFASLARARSEDDGSRNRGGELPTFRSGALGPEVDAALADMRPGEVRVVRSSRGFHVLELKGVQVTDFAAVRAEVERDLAARTVTGGDIRRYLDGLRAQARVERVDGAGRLTPVSAPPTGAAPGQKGR